MTIEPNATNTPRVSGLSTWADLPSNGRAAAAEALSDVMDTKALDVVLVETWLILHQLGLEAVVSTRVKSRESLLAKAKRKSIAPDAVLDRLALRIRVDEIHQCYAVFHQVCTRWAPIWDSFDDYIADPKSNGYQSLHVAVQTVFGAVEFQVRTHAMHREAEQGQASHWVYKARQANRLVPPDLSAMMGRGAPTGRRGSGT